VKGRTVWKFPLASLPTKIDLADGFRPVLFALQGVPGRPWVWIDHHPEARPARPVSFYVVGTGHPIPDGAIHAGSLLDGPFVWHLYYTHSDPEKT